MCAFPALQASLPRLTHFELDSAYQGLVAVEGLPVLASGERLPALASLALNGLSLVPLSSAPGGLRRSLSGGRASSGSPRCAHAPLLKATAVERNPALLSSCTSPMPATCDTPGGAGL